MNFTLNLDGNLAQVAGQDSKALAQLQTALANEQKTLAALERQLKNAGAAGVVNVETGRALSKAMTDSRAKIAAMTDELVKAGGAGRVTAEETGKLKGMSLLAADAFLNLAARAGQVLKALGDLGAQMIRFSEARGDFERGLESIYGSQEAAKHTYDVISTITDRVAVSQEKALSIFDRLEKAGIQNGDMAVRATESIAKAEAARKGAGDALQGVFERAGKSRFFSISRDEVRAAGFTMKELAVAIAQNTGNGVRDAELALRAGRVSLSAGLDSLTQLVDKKLGPIANKKFMTLGVQSQRLKDNIGRLFSTLDTSRVAFGLQRIADLFNENSFSGQALRVVIEGVFNGIAKAVEVVGPYVEIFFKSMVLLALKAYNAFRPLITQISEFFGNKGGVQSFEDAMLSAVDTAGKLFGFIADNAGTIAVTIATMLAPAVWGLVTALGAAALNAALSVAPFLLIGAAIYGAIKLGMWLYDVITGIPAAIAEVWEYFDGGAIVDGLVNGIKAGASKVVAAMKGLAGEALAAFKDAFGIRSPSKVMALQGRYINQGLERGLEDSSAGPERAMLTAPSEAPRLATQINNSRSGSSVSFGEGAIVINVNGGGSGESVRAAVMEVMGDLFEQFGLSQGAEA